MKDVNRYVAVFVLFSAALLAQTRFVILGDRTGETQGDVYASIWKQIKTEDPDFVVSVGDTIQGLNDETAESEWLTIERLVAPQWWNKLYLTPGNHDIWSDASQALFEKHAGHPHHYSFDHGPVHVTILDNSRSEQFPAEELKFLESDLAGHIAQPLKIVISHRPSWIFDAMLHNTDFPLHKLAKRFGVQYVIAGHVHQMLHAELDGVHYLSMPSAGGHLRGSMKYADGWFFGHIFVTIQNSALKLAIREVDGRVTQPADWGVAGLIKRPSQDQ